MDYCMESSDLAISPFAVEGEESSSLLSCI